MGKQTEFVGWRFKVPSSARSLNGPRTFALMSQGDPAFAFA
jgi:hypothetical protein